MRIPGPEEADAGPAQEIDAALAAFGLRADGEVIVEDEFVLWPDCENTFWLWLSIQTQWLIGPNGPTGLNYTSVITYLRELGLARKERQQYLAELQMMERAALHELREMRMNRT